VPCAFCGAEELVKTLENKLGIQCEQTTQATVTVNARIGTTPALLTAMLHQLLAQQPRGITATLVRHECFAPAPPQPTYRLQEDVP